MHGQRLRNQSRAGERPDCREGCVLAQQEKMTDAARQGSGKVGGIEAVKGCAAMLGRALITVGLNRSAVVWAQVA